MDLEGCRSRGMTDEQCARWTELQQKPIQSWPPALMRFIERKGVNLDRASGGDLVDYAAEWFVAGEPQ